MSGSPDSLLTKNSGWSMLTRLWVIAAGLLVLLVPVVYLSFLGVTAWALVGGALRAFERWALEPGWGLKNVGTFLGLAVGGITWAWFFRPFWLKSAKPPTKLEMKSATQPEWMETVAMAVVQAQARMPAEVCLDAGHEVRLEPQKGVLSGLADRHRLTVGAAWIGVCNEGQLIADMAACLAHSPAGVSGRFYWLMERMTRWLERAASGQHQQRLELEGRRRLSTLKKRKDHWWEKPLILRLARGYEALTRLPIRMMLLLARALTGLAMRRVEQTCDGVAVQLLGGGGYAELLLKKGRLGAASSVVAEKVAEGIQSERLPDNVVLQKVRECQQASERAFEAPPSLERRRKLALKRGGVGAIKEGSAASLLVRRYQEICRQLTQSHYQQDLGLSLNQIRLVAVAETAKRKGDDAALADIQRYFQGLAHPLRPICGLVEEGTETPTVEAMRKQIRASKQTMLERGGQSKSVMQEWTQSWQRRRDLEMAHAFALAGMPMDARQYGVNAHEPAIYREEIERQRMSMEYSDDALKPVEADMERRLAAALGLMMIRPVDACPGHLQETASALPDWGMAYGALCARLPVLWEIQNLGFALESLGLDGQLEAFKHAEAGTELEAQAQALGHLIPRMRALLGQLLEGLDQMPAPMKPDTSLAHWLIHEAAFPGWETLAEAVASGLAVMQVAVRFEETYQSVFAWICRAAEAAEREWAVESLGTEACETSVLGQFEVCESPLMQHSMALAAH